MFKKNKKLFVGIIIGFLLATAIPVSAAIEEYVLHKTDYKVFLAGKEYADEDYPLLCYKGKTYIPIRALIDAFNLNLDMSVNKTIKVSKPIGEWIKVDDYNAKFTDLPFIKSTSEGNIFSVKTSKHTYNFKYENSIWYVRVIE